MRVLITGPSLADPGGISNYFCEVLPHVRKRIENVVYFELGSSRSPSRWHIINDQVRFSAALREFRPDVVHVNPTLSWKGCLRDGLHVRMATARRIPVFVFFRGWNERFARRMDGRLGQLFRVMFNRATAFGVLSQIFERQLRQWKFQQPIHVGATAVSDEDFVDMDFGMVERERDSNPRQVLYMSRLEPEKGFLETIEAVQRIASTGRHVSLTVAGCGVGERELRRRLALVVPGTSVKFVGYVRGPDKLSLLKSHSIFCLPTRYEEGLPNALLEAMAAGMAVVTSPTAGIADVFKDGEMGISVPARDIDAIRRAVEELLNDEHRLRQIGKHNRAYAIERFLASHAAEWLCNRYLECASTQSSRLMSQGAKL